MNYRFNLLCYDTKGIYRLKSYNTEKSGCKYNVMSYCSGTKLKVIGSGFFHAYEIKKLKEYKEEENV